ncbi:MAG: flagellar hook-length control protein FliK [Planctomycetota bacterium]|nr:flagellar hook-length control protein FliK [Planctomycetota bacterium]
MSALLAAFAAGVPWSAPVQLPPPEAAESPAGMLPPAFPQPELAQGRALGQCSDSASIPNAIVLPDSARVLSTMPVASPLATAAQGAHDAELPAGELLAAAVRQAQGSTARRSSALVLDPATLASAPPHADAPSPATIELLQGRAPQQDAALPSEPATPASASPSTTRIPRPFPAPTFVDPAPTPVLTAPSPAFLPVDAATPQQPSTQPDEPARAAASSGPLTMAATIDTNMPGPAPGNIHDPLAPGLRIKPAATPVPVEATINERASAAAPNKVLSPGSLESEQPLAVPITRASTASVPPAASAAPLLDTTAAFPASARQAPADPDHSTADSRPKARTIAPSLPVVDGQPLPAAASATAAAPAGTDQLAAQLATDHSLAMRDLPQDRAASEQAARRWMPLASESPHTPLSAPSFAVDTPTVALAATARPSERSVTDDGEAAGSLSKTEAPTPTEAGRAWAPPQRLEASVPTPPLTPPTPVDQGIARQVARALVQHLPDGGERLVVRLTPPELGTVRIEFVARDGAMQALLIAEDEAVRQALERALPVLRSEVRSEHPQVELALERFSERQTWGDGQERRDRRHESREQARAQQDGKSAFSLEVDRTPRVEPAAMPARAAVRARGRIDAVA